MLRNMAEVESSSHYSTLAMEGLRWLVSGAARSTEGLWLSPDLGASSEHASLKLVSGFRVYRSASRGVAGVLYTMARLHRLGVRVEGLEKEVTRAVDWLLSHQDTADDQMPGLHFGECGVAVAIAEAIAAELIPPGPWTDPYLQEALTGPLDWPDLSHGAAGQGIAALICGELLSRPELALHATRCETYLLNSRNGEGTWTIPDGVRGMSGEAYTGFAHGAAGIVYFLARWSMYSGSAAALDAATQAGEWLIDIAQANDGYRSISFPLSDRDTTQWKWWCHGAPGISSSFLALWQATGEEHYAGAVRACLRVHPVEIRHGNLSQCHGLSGLGELYLDAYQAFGEKEWLDRADLLGRTLTALARHEDSGASWLVENPYQPTPDLMIGCGGVVHFLARLACAGQDTFSCGPLMYEGRQT